MGITNVEGLVSLPGGAVPPECTFEVAGVAATSPVVLGHADEGPFLGAVTLETLGLVLHPLSRRLVPMRLFLARMSAAHAPHVEVRSRA
jgi:hypothetical protein